jgi:hypothetical protein
LQVQSFVATLVTVGISINNIVNSIRGVMNAKAKFQSEVLIFLVPVLEALGNIQTYTEDIVCLLKDYILGPDVALMHSIQVRDPPPPLQIEPALEVLNNFQTYMELFN